MFSSLLLNAVPSSLLTNCATPITCRWASRIGMQRIERVRNPSTSSACGIDRPQDEQARSIAVFNGFYVFLFMPLHRVSKNVPPLACCNFDTHEWILLFFGRNVTDKVGNQKTLYYATSSDLYFLPGKTGEHENHIFTRSNIC